MSGSKSGTESDTALLAAPPEFRPFWDSLRDGRLSFPYCDACARFHWYPLKRCPGCASAAYHWRAIAGPGILFSWTVVRRAFSPEFADQVPYVIGLIEFDDAPGVRLISRLRDIPPDQLGIGMPVHPVITPGEAEEPPQLAFRAA